MKLRISLKPWSIKDSAFIVKTRNRPELMQYFRQDKPLTLKKQRKFMKTNSNYHGYIIRDAGRPVGVCALKYGPDMSKPELCIAADLKFHKEAIRLLMKVERETEAYGDVFSTNPALRVYLNMGFKVVGVEERYAYKRDAGFIDTITVAL